MSLRARFLFAANLAILATGAWFFVSHGLDPAGGDMMPHVAWAATLCLILSGLLWTAYNRFVARPLDRIRRGAEMLAEGNRAHRIDLAGRDEFARLAQSFNEMAERLAAVHDDLERQIEERTEDLQAVLAEVHERSQIAEEVNRRLAEADRRKTDFLTNVSHELRTPLNAILGFLNLHLDGVYENDREAREYLGNARLASEHLLAMVNDALGFARMEAGKDPVRLQPLHPGDVICDVLRILDPQVRQKKLAVKLDVGGRHLVLADESKLRQVLLNLVGNAVKFTDRGSISIRARAEGASVGIEVQDTGVGIPRDQLDRIFERFHQIDASPTRRHGGTGLGLAISRELVRLMGGSIAVSSEGPGRGATFRVTLPAAAPSMIPGE